MGEVDKKINSDEKKMKKEGDNGEGKDNSSKIITVVLKTDIHCEGCASKITKSVRSFDGVEKVTVTEHHKITVVGEVDPTKLRETLEKKIHKKVELVSPLPKVKNDDKAKQDNNEPKDKNDEKKSKQKELPVTTAVLKLHLHCDGCIEKIYKTVTKTKACEELKIDTQKDTITVRGAIDMKELAEVLKKQLKRDVEVVQPKKVEENKKDDGGNKEKVEDKAMPVNHYPVLMADPFPSYLDGISAYPSQMFSDENPNSCNVM